MIAEGPYFDELSVGQVFDSAPGLTLTSGLAQAHRSILGERLALPLDDGLSASVTGAPGLASPALVWDVAIGQSTAATHHVKANLFYRGLVFHRAPHLGDTLRSRTEVVGLRQNRAREGRWPTGLAALRITTADQRGEPVLDFWRCAMLPLRDPEAVTGHADDLDAVGAAVSDASLAKVAERWDLEPLRGPGAALTEGEVIEIGGGDVVSSAPELARLTLNIAKVHHDAVAGGGTRLVYGGHTIGLALAQATRALPGIATVTGWHSCDHLGPVVEGDTLRSALTVERCEPTRGGRLVHLRSRVTADAPVPRDVLDWRFAALVP
ncbi:MaoC family dehydratase [Saccharopolyspora sp. TS4A08]|uniref:MaoC family dehydratase n=1 Tax=Saccharopolyspora ipomoeae TaxID=3042027 RepID=A0ABT6PS42_9PSEU|nr:MaoC family dehydratase [Saccharopolyspora sp. TS4A08]MDI2030236.1 MaoC family dehydratase [Saccharopolyspora sp. TS4A08]